MIQSSFFPPNGGDTLHSMNVIHVKTFTFVSHQPPINLIWWQTSKMTSNAKLRVFMSGLTGISCGRG